MAAPFGGKNWNLFRYQKKEHMSVPKMETYFGTRNWNLFRYQKVEPILVPEKGTYFGAQNWNLKVKVFETLQNHKRNHFVPRRGRQPRYIHTAVRNRARNCLRHARGKSLRHLGVLKIEPSEHNGTRQ